MFNISTFFDPNTHCALSVALLEKRQVPFYMAIVNVEVMPECFPKHSRIKTARMRQKEPLLSQKETEE